MEKKQRDSRLLASLAVFRELYDSNRDVYGVISDFITDLIKNERIYTFNLTDITDKFNKTYEFDIPPAVVKASLGRLSFIEKTEKNYIVNSPSKINETNINKKQEQINSNNEFIIKELFKFIEEAKNTELTKHEKARIAHSFSNFLLDESNGNDYLEYITAFILKRESDIKFKNQLNLIREGVILYSGIKYNLNLNEVGSWRTELTIFIGTETLFYLAGYNGELYRNLVLDFLHYVREINDKANKRLIKLRYFSEVKKEIDKFFGTAEKIVKGLIKPNPDRSAMLCIIEGCNQPSDVMEKQADFYSLLKRYAIEEDSFKEYFTPENFKYNVINKETIETISNEFDRDASDNINFLNYISIRRKGLYASNFENIGYILLTGNGTTLKAAWNELLKDKKQVPLATNLSFLTNKFWFKLNKGFGKNDLPDSFNIITKAQVILSNILDTSVGEKYRELQNEFNKGSLTEEQAKERIIYLRKKARNPEQIKNENVNDVLDVITEDSLEAFIEEQKHYKVTAENQRQENIELKEKLIQKSEVEKELLLSKQDLLKEKSSQKQLLEDQKFLSDEDSQIKYRRLKLIITLLIISFTAILLYFSYKMWDETENWTFMLFTLLPFATYYLYMLWTEKELSPLQQLQQRKIKIFTENYKKFNFDTNKLFLINQDIDKLNVEIDKLKTKSNSHQVFGE